MKRYSVIWNRNSALIALTYKSCASSANRRARGSVIRKVS